MRRLGWSLPRLSTARPTAVLRPARPGPACETLGPRR